MIRFRFVNLPLKLINLAKSPEKPENYDLDCSFFQNNDIELQSLKLNEIEKLFLSPQKAAFPSFQEFYKGSKHTDVILKIKTLEEFRLHKMVLITASRYFNEILENHTSNEIIRITLPDFVMKKPLEFMIKFMYFGAFSQEDLKDIEAFLARDLFILAGFFKIHLLMEFIGLRVLIPQMNIEICLDILRESNKLLKTLVSKEKILMILYRFSLNYLANNMKNFLRKEELRQKLENSGFERDLYIKIASLALEKAQDFDSIEKILAFIAKRGDLGSNIIEIFRNIVKNFPENIRKHQIQAISKRFLEEIQGLNPKETFLLRLKPEELDEIFEFPEGKCFLLENEKSDYSSNNSAQLLELFKNRETSFSGEFSLANINENQRNFIVSQSFSSENRRFQAFFDIKGKVLDFYIQDLGFKKLKYSFLSFSSVLIRISIFRERNYWLDLCFFHSFSNNSNEILASKSIPWSFQAQTLIFKVWVIEYPLYAGSLQYLSENFKKIVKEKDLNIVRSLLLSQEKEKTPDFYTLGENEVFDLLRNSSEENKISAVFLFKYLKGKALKSSIFY